MALKTFYNPAKSLFGRSRRGLFIAALLVIGFASNGSPSLILATGNSQAGEYLQGPLLVTITQDQNSLLLIDMASGQQRQLSFGDGNLFLGDFSPNGCEILFTWERTPGNIDLFAARLDGSELRQVMDIGRTGALSYRVSEPDWSPDGQRIVFTLIRYYNPPDDAPYRLTHIAWVPPEGGEPRFYSNSGTEFQPRWSSDGRYLLYVSVQAVTEYEGPITDELELETKPELWLVMADGSNKRRFSNFASGGVYNPQWSPDDSLVAFVHEPSPGNHQIMAVPFDGSRAPFYVLEDIGTVLAFDWQPDGQRIVAAAQGIADYPHNVLWEVPLGQNNNPQLLLPDARPAYNDYPRYSPDGRWLAFRSAYQLTALDTAEGTIQSFGSTSANNSPPLWSPPGFQGEQACQYPPS